jgi:hypothetical protein
MQVVVVKRYHLKLSMEKHSLLNLCNTAADNSLEEELVIRHSCC